MRIGDILPNQNVTKDVPWYQQLVNTLTQAGTAYLSIEQQRELNKANLARAQQGLPPLDASMFQTGVNVGLGQQTQNTLLWVVGGVAGVWLLTSILNRSRR